MAKSFQALQAEIAKLKEVAEQARQKEMKSVVARIQDAIKVYGLTETDLFGTKQAERRFHVEAKAGRAGSKRGAPKANKLTGTKVPPKYRDTAGNTWTGRGLQPRWLKAALSQGKKLEDFAIA